MPLIASNGISLNAVEIGSHGPRVVMLHGLFTGSSASWYFTSAPTLARDFHILLYDLRSHGRSQRVSTGFDTATQVADLLGVLDHMGWQEPVALVGHSYGALIALHFALAYPERVGKLALVEVPLPPSELPDLEAFIALGPSRMKDALPEAMKLTIDRRGRQAGKLLGTLSHLAFETSLLADIKAERDVPDAALARLNKPLLVFGESSACFKTGQRLSRIIPGAQWVPLQGGHYLSLEAPEALTAALQAYLKQP